MTDADLAERLTRRRARVMFVLAALFITQQGSYFTNTPMGAGAVAPLKIAAWLVISVVLLVGFATGGGWARSAKVRALMNDETTRAHRATATTIGFYNAMATGVVIYGLAMVKPIFGRDAVHVMMTVGIASALIAFAGLERAALRTTSRR